MTTATERDRVREIKHGVTWMGAQLKRAQDAVGAIIYPDPNGPPQSEFIQRRMSSLRSLYIEIRILVECLDVHGDWLLEIPCVGGINLSSAEQSLEKHIQKGGQMLAKVTGMCEMYPGMSDVLGPEWPTADSLGQSASDLANLLHHD